MPMMMKCLLLKDTPEHTRQLLSCIQKSPSLSLEATASNVKETLQLIDTVHPDILFLNSKHYAHIRSELSGKEKMPAFICITSDDMVAEVHPAYTSLTMSGNSLAHAVFLEAVNHALVQLIAANPDTSEREGRFFFIKSEYRIIKVNFHDIIFCEGLKDYTQVYTIKKAKPIITLQNLKTFSERLPPRDFVRIHRSFIVALDRIESITKKEVEIADKILPIGNSYRNNLLDIVKRNS